MAYHVKDRIYIPGDFYRIDERTGRKVRAKDTRKEWTGRIVNVDSWEERQPQDFVRGVRDDQFVPEPRPRQVDTFLGPLTTTLSAKFTPSNPPWLLNVVSTVRMENGDKLQIILDGDANTATTTITSIISLTQIQISTNLPFSASSGNLVTDISAVALANIG